MPQHVLSATAQVHGALFLTMMVWGLNLSAVKLLTHSLDIVLVAALRMLLAALVLAALLARGGRRPAAPPLRTWLWLALAAFFLVYSQQIAFAAGLARTSATHAALVMALGPTVSLALEALTYGRPVRRSQWLGVLLALLGVAAVVLNRPQGGVAASTGGDLLVLGSVVFFALGGLLVQKLTREFSPLEVSLAVHALGALMLWLHVLAWVEAPLPQVAALGPWPWAMAAFSAVFATGLGSVVWSRGIATLGVGQTASYLSWVPIFGVGFGALIFREALSAWHALGLAGVLAGSLLVVRRR